MLSASARRRVRLFWYGVFVLNLAVILFFWWRGTGAGLRLTVPSLAVGGGRLLGLLGAYFIVLQFFTMGRNPWLERAFGLDRLSILHRTLGTWGILLILTHPLFLAVGYAAFEKTSILAQILGFFGIGELIPAIIGLGLFVALVALSITIVRKRLRYELWYLVHLTAYAAVFLAFGHQTELGGDFNASALFGWYWLALYAAVLASQVLFRFLRPAYFLWRHRFHVDLVQPEARGVVSIIITGRRVHQFPIEPGQFLILRFLAKGFWYEAHPFSLSNLPGGPSLRVTVKGSGDYTRKVANLRPGTPVLIDGAYGVYVDDPDSRRGALLIAGGIGITPNRSLLERLLARGRDVVLLYGMRTPDDFVFQHELYALAGRSTARIIPVFSDARVNGAEEGRIDREKIERLVPDVRERDVYLCGPAVMMQAVVPVLHALGVPPPRLHFEEFAW